MTYSEKSNKKQKKDVFNLLEGLMYKFEDDIPNLITDIEEFFLENEL